MSDSDRQKWDDRYRAEPEPAAGPARFLLTLDDVLPRSGRALDVAGGAGRHAVWLAERGLDVTLADISPEGLRIAERRAAAAGLRVTVLAMDLERRALPAGPWDLIVSVDFLLRPLFQSFTAALAPAGLLVVVQPTVSNLERHARPGRAFLLEAGELPGLVRGLTIERYEEGWSDEGRHEARLVARRA